MDCDLICTIQTSTAIFIRTAKTLLGLSMSHDVNMDSMKPRQHSKTVQDPSQEHYLRIVFFLTIFL
jgi:hypothetical protein